MQKNGAGEWFKIVQDAEANALPNSGDKETNVYGLPGYDYLSSGSDRSPQALDGADVLDFAAIGSCSLLDPVDVYVRYRMNVVYIVQHTGRDFGENKEISENSLTIQKNLSIIGTQKEQMFAFFPSFQRCMILLFSTKENCQANQGGTAT